MVSIAAYNGVQHCCERAFPWTAAPVTGCVTQARLLNSGGHRTPTLAKPTRHRACAMSAAFSAGSPTKKGQSVSASADRRQATRRDVDAPTRADREVPRSTVGDIEATTGATHPQESRRVWCPGAESNHRHGDFQSLFAPLRTASFPLRTSVKHPSMPVKAGTPKHGHARSLANSATTPGGGQPLHPIFHRTGSGKDRRLPRWPRALRLRGVRPRSVC